MELSHMQFGIVGCFLGSFMGVLLMYLAITFDPKGDKVPSWLRRYRLLLKLLCLEVFQTISSHLPFVPTRFLHSQNGTAFCK